MKLKKGLMIHATPDGTVAVATGEVARSFNGMLRLTPTAEFIVRCLQDETTAEEVANALVAKYEIDYDTAKRDVDALIAQLSSVGLME